ncbi:MAG: MFS transporter [Scytonematopsis contorta HA4267-MV1]|jgi:MFS family permease|nr:MFS transporter [Scytonematopsis contorta HA4267-MV1]
MPIIGLIAAESLSLLGNQIAAVAIPILVLQYTNSPLVAGIASVGNIIPIILAAILGGRAIDRFGAWNTSIAADILSFFSVLTLPLAFIYFDEVSPLLIFLLVFLGALFDPTGTSARQTLVPSLASLSGKSLQKINSWRGGLENGADFLGPIIGVALIGASGIINTFFINAATFLLCAGIFCIVVPKRVQASRDHEDAALSGINFVFKHPQIRTLAIIGMIGNCVILPFLSLLLPVLTTSKFDSNTLLGISLSVFGLAATIGATSFSVLSNRFSRSAIYYGGLLVTGGSIILCAFATNQYEVVLSSGLAGLLLGAGNPLSQTILQEETPEMMAGKVFTSFSAIHFIGGSFGLLLAGFMTELSNVEQVLIQTGSLLMALAIFGWYRLPLLTSNSEN